MFNWKIFDPSKPANVIYRTLFIFFLLIVGRLIFDLFNHSLSYQHYIFLLPMVLSLFIGYYLTLYTSASLFLQFVIFGIIFFLFFTMINWLQINLQQSSNDLIDFIFILVMSVGFTLNSRDIQKRYKG